MYATVEDIINEKQYCCEKVQQAVDKYSKLAMTEMKIRNILQIELKDEIKPTNDQEFYVEFARLYNICNTIEEMKKSLVDNLKQ